MADMNASYLVFDSWLAIFFENHFSLAEKKMQKRHIMHQKTHGLNFKIFDRRTS